MNSHAANGANPCRDVFQQVVSPQQIVFSFFIGCVVENKIYRPGPLTLFKTLHRIVQHSRSGVEANGRAGERRSMVAVAGELVNKKQKPDECIWAAAAAMALGHLFLKKQFYDHYSFSFIPTR